MNKTYLYIPLLFFLSCVGKKKQFGSPVGYDFSKPEMFSVPESLDEISGICFHNGKGDTIYCEQDEQGKVYYLHLADKNAAHVKFGKGGDYEDIAIFNDQVFLLRSDGTLFSFPFNEINQEQAFDSK